MGGSHVFASPIWRAKLKEPGATWKQYPQIHSSLSLHEKKKDICKLPALYGIMSNTVHSPNKANTHTNWWKAFFLYPIMAHCQSWLLLESQPCTQINIPTLYFLYITKCNVEIDTEREELCSGCRGDYGAAGTQVRRREQRAGFTSTSLHVFKLGKKETQEREWNEDKQAVEVCGEQTEDNGVWVTGDVFAVTEPWKRRRAGERPEWGRT